MKSCLSLFLLPLFILGLAQMPLAEEQPIRLGLIGLDTSHVIAFTKFLNDPTHPDHVPGAKVVAAFKGGSPDIESSISRVDEYTEQLQKEWNIEIVDSIPELCKKVDGILLESVDGRPHLEQARPVIEAGLPLFIDKPLAGTYEDVLELAKLAKAKNVPWFGGSSLRWWQGVRDAIDPETVGDIIGCDAYSPCSLEEHHPDLFWYGVHGVEILYAAMGKGCKQVSRYYTDDTDVVVGVWDDGRIGTFRGTRKGEHGYGATVFGSKKIATASGHSYKGLVEQIVKFFQTKLSPIDPAEMVEMYAFMQMADESKKLGGKPVALPAISLE
ncbi:MAG: Gfo/Idh/MocA family oxidoreductase [bacterium]|jgi:predicted dehydrogenase|nr:Gfo/Idh/MocA family oxidoreductase [bacterium]